MKQIQISPDKAKDYIDHIAYSEKTEKIKAIKLFLEWCLKTGRISEDTYLNLTPLLMGEEARKEHRNMWQLVRAKMSNMQTTLSSIFANITPDDLQRTVSTARRSGLLTYVSLLSLLLFIGALGAGIYSQFFIKPSTPFAYPTVLTPGSRTLSFQGRLTDSLGNPITTSTNVTFKLYDNSSGGTQLYTTGACSLTPDQDGIFSTIIGQSCGSAIGSSVFSENANVYLETTVAAETLSPRQQIANVGYAINAENLQGFPPGTNTSNIPFINRDGDMYFHVANPGIRSSHASANFTLSSAVGVIVQSAGTGDITLTATGSGAINLKTANASRTTTLDTNGDLKIGGGTFNNTSVSEDLYVTGNIEADGTIYGNGSGLTGITASSITANTLDFTEFKNSMALDANLALAQGAYTWSQTFTGTTGPGLAYTASGAVTAGNAAAFDINASNASTSVPAVMISNAGSSYGLRVNDDGTTTDSTPFIVDAAGNVGIGTTTAGAALDVNGNILVQGTGTIDTRAAGTLTIGGATQTGLILGRSGQSSRIANLTTDGPIYTSGANGTLNSEAQLAIARGGTNTNATPSNGQVAYGTGTAYAFTSGGSTGNCLTYNSGSAPTWGTCLSGTVPWSSLTNPSGALSLSMSTNGTTFAWAQTTTNAFTNTFNSLTSGKGLYLSSTATGMTGNMMELDLTGSNSGNTGNVLRAAVSGTSSAAVPLMVTNLGTGSSFRVNDETGDTDTTPFVIDASGNVGIGTTSPGAPLAVDLSNASNNMMEATRITRSNSSGAGAADLGVYGSYYGETSNSSNLEMGRIGYKWDIASNGAAGDDGTNNRSRFIVYSERGKWDEMLALFSAYSTGGDRYLCLNDADLASPDCFGMTIGSANALQLAFDGTNRFTFDYSNGSYSISNIVSPEINTRLGFLTLGSQPMQWDTSNNGTDMILMSDGKLGVGDITPASLLTVGNGDLFQVDTNGDVVKLKNLTYSWPSAHTANGALVNNGSGTLSWSTLGTSNITDNSLDFIDFQDTLDLDANLTLNQTTYTWSQSFTGTTTTGLTYAADSLTSGKGLYVSSTATGLTGNMMELDLTGSNSGNTGNVMRVAVSGTSSAAVPLMVTNLGTGSSFRVNDATGDADTTPFVIDASGNVGIGTSAPAASLHVSGTSAIFGVGEAGTPTATTIRGAAGSGTDVAGATITFDASNGTGNGGSGDFSFRTASNSAQLPLYDTGTSANTGTAASNTLAWSHTVGTLGTSGKSILLVSAAIKNATSQTVTTITYGAQSLTNLSTSTNGTNVREELWYLRNPNTGSNTITITLAGGATARMVGGAASYYNVDQTNTFGAVSTNTGTTRAADTAIVSQRNELVVAFVAKNNSTEAITPYAKYLQTFNNVTTNATASNNVISAGLHGIGQTSQSPGANWSTTNREWAVVAVPLKGVSTSGSSANTLTEILNINQTAVTVKGLFNIGPTIRYTRTGVAYNASIITKDAQCTSEFGSSYQTASARDVSAYAFGGTSSTNSFNTTDTTTSWYGAGSANGGDIITTAGATTAVACIRKDAPFRLTRYVVWQGSSDATKDNQCVNEYGPNYQAARVQDASSYLGTSVSTTANGDKVNFAVDTTNSYYSWSGSTYDSWQLYTVTGVFAPLACIRTGVQSNGADYAEFIQTLDTPTAGDILTVDERNEVMAKREDKAYSGKMLGIVATEPGFVLGSESQDTGNTVLALSGRVPVKVMTDNPSTLMIGDHITSSGLSGVGQKLTKVGPTVGKLLQSGSSWNENSCLTVDSFEDIMWPQGDGKNQDKSCFKIARENIPESIRPTLSGEYLYIGKLMVQIGLSWADPAIYMTDEGKVKIALLPSSSAQNSYQGVITNENSTELSVFALTDVAGSVIEKSITASRAVLANVESGLLISQKAIINSLSVTRLTAASMTSDSISSLTGILGELTVRERLTSPLVQTETLVATGSAQLAQLETSIVKPDSTTLTIDLSQPKVASDEGDKGPLASVVIRGREGKKVAELDDAGNATFNGTIAALQTQTNTLTADSVSTLSVEAQNARIQSLEATDATLSGRIIAKDIQSENINKLTSDTQTLYTNVNQIQSLLAGIQTQKLSDAQFYQNLGNSPLSFDIDGNTILSENLTVAGDTKLYNASVANSLSVGNIHIQDNGLLSLAWDLKLSALATITLFDGSVQIARDGTITTQGTLIAKGGVKTDKLEATAPDKDLNVILGSSTTVNEQSGEVETRNAKLAIQDLTGIEQASIDSSGSAQFRNLSLNIYSDPVVLSPMDNFQKNGTFKAGIETTDQSAGAGLVPANEDEVVIYNSLIKQNSLVYLTPVNNIPDLQLTVISKNVCSSGVVGCKPSFTVSSGSLNHDTLPFNWLIIN